MSGFSNPGYLNDKGEKVVLITAIDPRTNHLKQFERDCYDSGLIAGIRAERERINKLITEQVVEWIDYKGDAYYPDVLTDVIDGKTND